jgi:hypothetical protein
MSKQTIGVCMATNNKEQYVKIQVLEYPIVEFENKKKELYDALYITDNNILTGHIIEDDDNSIFVVEGGIPRNNIARINGGITRQVYQKRSSAMDV